MIRRLTSDGKPAGHGARPAQDELGRFRWEIYVRRAGKRIHRIVWARTRGEAALEEDAARTGTVATGITWSAGLRLWSQAKAPTPEHLDNQKRNVDGLIAMVGDIPIEATTAEQFGRWVDSRAKHSNRSGNHARAIRSIATWLRSRDMIAQVPFEHVRGCPTRPQRPRRQVDNPAPYLAALASSRPIVEFILLTGVRSSEACNLTAGDISDGVARFRQKGGSFREVPLDEGLLKTVRPGGFCFTNSRGAKWNKWSLLHACKARWKRAGLAPITIHELRHTFATLAARSGFNAQQLREAMGWTTAKMADRYVHLGREDARAVGDAVRSEIRKKLAPQ